MLTRLLKMLSGLALCWRRRPQGRARQETTARADCRILSHQIFVGRSDRGVNVSLPLDCPVAPGGKTPRMTVRLGTKQAEALSRIFLKPGSNSMGFGFDGNDGLLVAGWSGGRAEIEATHLSGGRLASLTLSAAQAGRLGGDIAGHFAGEVL